MNSNCMKEKCGFWEEKNGEILCPFFIKTIWRNDEGKEKIFDDCAPRRNTILLIDYSIQAMEIQRGYEEQKNKYDEVLERLGKVLNEMQKRNKILKEKLQIEE